MASAAAAATMAATIAAAGGLCRMRFTAGRRENGKFLGQLGRAAMRTFSSFPVTGTDKDFAVALAFLAMKFVNRHEPKITGTTEISSESPLTFPPTRSSQLELAQNSFQRGRYWSGLTSAATNHGDNFSRCGRWSRFQRTRAASLVSTNRNFNVGDSTWPSQNTTLACPW